MIQTFLESFCFLIWYLARAENDNYEVVEVLIGEPFDLDNFFTCNESWTVDGEEKSMPLVAEANMAAFYKCPSIDKEVFVIVLKKELTFVLESLKSVSQGEVVKLACSVEFNTAGFSFDHYMAITNSSGIKIAETTEKSAQGRDYEVLLRGEETPSYGLNAYLCVWRYTISKDKKEWPQANFDEMNITVEVNRPVGNVRISKSVVNRYESVQCLADGYPSISYEWICQFNDSADGNWVSKDSVIVMKDSGNFTCNCSVSNVINGKEYWSTWTGVISSYGEGGDSFAVVDGQENEDLGKEIYQETSVDSVIIKTMSTQSTRTVSSPAPKTVKPSTAGASDRVPARSEADSLFQGQSILVRLGLIVCFVSIHN